ncbi:MAG: hypothetical protein JWN95_3944 [Frankiales bacterium]|nr:hypothetical protein [Frankiales bacterium]
MTAIAPASFAAEKYDLSLDGELVERRRAATALYDAEVALHISLRRGGGAAHRPSDSRGRVGCRCG